MMPFLSCSWGGDHVTKIEEVLTVRNSMFDGPLDGTINELTIFIQMFLKNDEQRLQIMCLKEFVSNTSHRHLFLTS